MKYDRVIAVEIGGFALLIAFWAYGMWWWAPIEFIPSTWFGLLVTLPGVLAIVNHFAVTVPRFSSRRETVLDYNAFCDGFDEWWLRTGWPKKLEAAHFDPNAKDYRIRVKKRNAEDDLCAFRPIAAAAVWGAVVLTLVFEIAAGVADGFHDTWGDAGFPVEISAMNGFLYASLGAFVSVMWRMINRINANALTARFVFTCALRTAVAMMIGLAAGKIDLFGDSKSQATGVVFFLIGLFTDWALTSLRNRARTVFNQPNDPCDRLPLCFIDGLDDGVIDILDELGIWDVQHLATSEPGELTIRTLYPFNRIIDWIDQAILISYFRRGIADARKLGITGAIDLTLLYSLLLEAPKDSPERTKANNILDELSKKSSMSRDSIELIASNLYFDYTVEQLYRFWQHHRTDDASSSTPPPEHDVAPQ